MTQLSETQMAELGVFARHIRDSNGPPICWAGYGGLRIRNPKNVFVCSPHLHSLFGYYRVIQTIECYVFVLMERMEVTDLDPTPEVAFIHLDNKMGVGDFENVTPDKIDMFE